MFDKISKFGTLIKLTKNVLLDGTKKAFQIGRTVLTFMMKKEKLDANQQVVMGGVEVEMGGAEKNTVVPMIVQPKKGERPHRKNSH